MKKPSERIAEIFSGYKTELYNFEVYPAKYSEAIVQYLDEEWQKEIDKYSGQGEDLDGGISVVKINP